MMFVLGLMVRRRRGNVAEIRFECAVSRIGDVIFVGSEARGHCAVGPLVTCWCWLAYRDIAKAVCSAAIHRGWSLIYVETGSRHTTQCWYFDGDCRTQKFNISI